MDTLCKENYLVICNGRLEDGECTFKSQIRNRPVESTTDYLLTSFNNFNFISDMHVLEMTEFSDHCPVAFKSC